ncbi:MAG: diaminopimelate decarboxylase [Myxococcota bacterium]
MRHFDYREDGTLYAEDVSLVELADVVGTPAFVYAEATVDRHLQVFDAAFDGHPHLVCYAMKANSSRPVLELVRRRNAGVDIVSGGELFRARRAGIPANRIVFSGVGKTAAEMAYALDEGILAFNVESEPELRRLAEVSASKGLVAPVSLRVNPDVDPQTHPYIATGLAQAKFGIPMTEAPRLAAWADAQSSLRMDGVDCHIGSQLTRLPPLLEALESVLDLVDRLRSSGHAIEHIDMGGGLGIPYDQETPPHPLELGRAVLAKLRGRPERLILEPGRVIVGNAGILLTRVLYRKTTPTKTFVVVDAAMNDLLRPVLYDAQHEILPVRAGPAENPLVSVDVVGPVCETADCFAKDRLLPLLEPGDLVAVMSAGAYGHVMSSQYNSRPRAPEIWVSGARFHVGRRRERYEDLVSGESVPPWFQAGETG